MNKKTKLLISSLCVGVFALSCFGGCLKDGDGIDKTKTQLYVNNYNRGFGDEWLYKAAERFEELHAEDVYEEGKKGVEVIVDPNDSSGNALLDKIESSRGDVFFSEHVYIHEFVNRGLVADVTKEVTSVLSQYGEERSIEDKMTAEQKSYYNINGKYYGVPHYANYMGIICDVDFFDENDLWFKAKSATDGTTDGFISTAAGETIKSAGPDGQLGTYDDGFPATYDEFFQLCDKIADGIGQPIIWAGFSQEDYLQTLMTAMQAEFEGLEQMSLNYNFNGTATHLVDSIAADGTITYKAPTEIKNSNGYEVTGQAGKYYATKFIKTILANENYYNVNHTALTYYHTDAQHDFLTSVNKQKRIGMLLDGAWWMNEADGEFEEMAANNPEMSKMNRRFCIMPYPKATEEQVGQKQTLLDTHQSLGFVSAFVPEYKMQLAKDFLQFCSTDESLAEYTVVTNSMKALNYTLSEKDEQKLSYYGKSTFDLKAASDIVYPYSNNPMYLNFQSSFAKNLFVSQQSESATPQNRPIEALLEKSTSAETFFYGYRTYYKSIWNTYRAYFE